MSATQEQRRCRLCSLPLYTSAEWWVGLHVECAAASLHGDSFMAVPSPGYSTTHDDDGAEDGY